MRKMRVVLMLATVMTVALAAPLAAQGGGGQGGGRQGGARQGADPAAMQAQQNERLFQGITLSAAQKTKVDSIQNAARVAQQAAAQSGGMRDPETRQRMMAQRQATMAAIRGVLTPEQHAAFDKNLGSMPAAGGGRQPERQGPPRS